MVTLVIKSSFQDDDVTRSSTDPGSAGSEVLQYLWRPMTTLVLSGVWYMYLSIMREKLIEGGYIPGCHRELRTQECVKKIPNNWNVGDQPVAIEEHPCFHCGTFRIELL